MKVISIIKKVVFAIVAVAMVLLSFSVALAAGEDIVNFTDENLKQALIDFGADTSGDQELSEDEMAALSGSLDFSAREISDISGLEFAIAIEAIDLSNNTIRDIEALTQLDLTNLDISQNYLDLTADGKDITDIGVLQTAGCTVVYEPQKAIPVLDVTIDESVDMCPGDTIELTVGIIPEDAADKSVSWQSNNTGVVTVSEGVLTAVSVGTAKVTVTTQDGGYSAQCDVNVVTDEMTSSKYAIYNGKLWFTTEGTSVQELLSELYNDSRFLSVHNEDGSIYEGDSVGTGMTVRLTVGDDIKQELTILTRGDASGDGKVSIADYTLVRLHILELKDLENEYLFAADLNLDGELTISDYTVSRLHILGLATISESYTPVDPGVSIDPTNPNDPGYLDTISNSKIRKFIEIALSQQGAEYVSGAEGPYELGHDCSGLVYYCLRQAGYSSVWRATACTYSDFKKIADDPYDWDWIEDLGAVNANPSGWYWPWQFVAAEDMQPGDLMFYEKETDDVSAYEAKPIGHVGIYLGNGYHIHASSTYGQVIVSRFDGWYKEWFRYARRVNW